MIGPSTVSEADAASFHTVRPRLFGIAYQVLGSANEADDVVQDAWIRWQDTDRSRVRDAAAFLATTTARLAINVTQSARARREMHLGPSLPEPADAGADPAAGAEQGEALELAVRILLEKLSPAERAVYLLREAFEYPYRQISQVLGLSEANARQLAARARRRLSGELRRPVAASEKQVLLDAVAAAAQTGDLATLEHLLSADVAAGGGEVVALARPMKQGFPDLVAA
jgi:RNA polymerase sigma-70 factor, ECF subfamily